MHYFPSLTMEDVLWGYSFINLAMLMNSIPSYDLENEKKKKANKLEIKDINDIKDLL